MEKEKIHKILLAEDTLINAKIAITFLEKWGLHVSHAINGEEAVKMAREYNFDLCLLDLQMPIMSGEEAIKLIKEIDYYKSIPIVAFTAKTLKKGVVERMGFDGYLPKPLDFNEMKTYIFEKLSKSQEPS